jgi:hypothetical protein
MTTSGPTPGFAHLGAFLRTRPAFAANFLDERIEIIATIVIGDLVAGLDVLDRSDLDGVFHEVDFGIRSARMIDIARAVSAAGAVNGPAAVDLEEIACIELVGDFGSNPPPAVANDELTLLDWDAGEET